MSFSFISFQDRSGFAAEKAPGQGLPEFIFQIAGAAVQLRNTDPGIMGVAGDNRRQVLLQQFPAQELLPQPLPAQNAARIDLQQRAGFPQAVGKVPVLLQGLGPLRMGDQRRIAHAPYQLHRVQDLLGAVPTAKFQQDGAAFAQGSEFASLSDFIRDCRLEYSCNLLVTRPDLSIKEVAAKSGFNYASNYSSDFKNRYTMTPSIYRDLKAKK